LRPEHILRFVAERLELRSTISNAITIKGVLRAYLRGRATPG
jgi:hypothetical protein